MDGGVKQVTCQAGINKRQVEQRGDGVDSAESLTGSEWKLHRMTKTLNMVCVNKKILEVDDDTIKKSARKEHDGFYTNDL